MAVKKATTTGGATCYEVRARDARGKQHRRCCRYEVDALPAAAGAVTIWNELQDTTGGHAHVAFNTAVEICDALIADVRLRLLSARPLAPHVRPHPLFELVDGRFELVPLRVQLDG